MRRKLYFNNKQFTNDDIRDIEALEHKKFFKQKFKEEYDNEISKVYEIDTHGKFTIIVRSSLFRLHVTSRININPCYLYDLSSICESNLNDNQYLDRNRKRKKWNLLHEKIKKLLMKNKKFIQNEVTSTLIVHTSTTQTRYSPVIIQQEHSYYGFYASLFIISIIILGFILWYIFVKNSQKPKSIVRSTFEGSDSDDNNNNNNNQYKIDVNSLKTNRTADSLSFDDDNDSNYLERKYFKSIKFSIIGQILSDLIQQAINLQLSADLLTFLSYTSQFIHILRTIIINKCSCKSLNPIEFLQYQYLVDILHNSEFILEYLHEHNSHEKVFLVEILTHLY